MLCYDVMMCYYICRVFEASPVTLLYTSFAMHKSAVLPAKVSAAWPAQILHVCAAERD